MSDDNNDDFTQHPSFVPYVPGAPTNAAAANAAAAVDDSKYITDYYERIAMRKRRAMTLDPAVSQQQLAAARAILARDPATRAHKVAFPGLHTYPAHWLPPPLTFPRVHEALDCAYRFVLIWELIAPNEVVDENPNSRVYSAPYVRPAISIGTPAKAFIIALTALAYARALVNYHAIPPTPVFKALMSIYYGASADAQASAGADMASADSGCDIEEDPAFAPPYPTHERYRGHNMLNVCEHVLLPHFAWGNWMRENPDVSLQIYDKADPTYNCFPRHLLISHFDGEDAAAAAAQAEEVAAHAALHAYYAHPHGATPAQRNAAYAAAYLDTYYDTLATAHAHLQFTLTREDWEILDQMYRFVRLHGIYRSTLRNGTYDAEEHDQCRLPPIIGTHAEAFYILAAGRDILANKHYRRPMRLVAPAAWQPGLGQVWQGVGQGAGFNQNTIDRICPRHTDGLTQLAKFLRQGKVHALIARCFAKQHQDARRHALADAVVLAARRPANAPPAARLDLATLMHIARRVTAVNSRIKPDEVKARLRLGVARLARRPPLPPVPGDAENGAAAARG